MAKVYIGTSGYSYADWVGPVYPKGTPKEDFLSFYADEFSVVELNFSYYAMPKAPALQRMLEKTPDDFLFSIKTHRSLTHEISANVAENAILFRDGIKPLSDSSRLGTVLLQFPYSFHYNPTTRRHLDHVCRLLHDLPLAVEFRNSEWQRESVYATMRKKSICFVNVDEPDLARLPRPDDTLTAELGYIRFHGRNKQNWWHGDNASRYDYLYSDEELDTWMSKIFRIMEKARILIVAFNNHFRGQAVQNARRLKHLLQEHGV